MGPGCGIGVGVVTTRSPVESLDCCDLLFQPDFYRCGSAATGNFIDWCCVTSVYGGNRKVFISIFTLTITFCTVFLLPVYHI